MPIFPISQYVTSKPLSQIKAARITLVQFPRTWSHVQLSNSTALEQPDCAKDLYPPPGLVIEFTSFSKLPKELQLEIWSLSLIGNRHVVLEFCRDKKCLVTKTPPPAALYTCAESRSVALGMLEKLSDSETTWRKGNRPNIYINPEFDMVQFPEAVFNPSLAELAGPLGIAFPRYAQFPIHCLVLDLDLFYKMYSKKEESLLWMRLCMFSTLKGVVISCNLSKRYSGDGLHMISMLASLRFSSEAKTMKRCSPTYQGLDLLTNDQASELVNFVDRIGGDLEEESCFWKPIGPRSTEKVRRIDVAVLVTRDSQHVKSYVKS